MHKIFSLYLGLVLTAIIGSIIIIYFIAPTAVEAQSPQRLQIQTHRSWGYKEVGVSTGIVVICDTANGNLIYSAGYQGGLAVVPGGCQKKLAEIDYQGALDEAKRQANLRP